MKAQVKAEVIEAFEINNIANDVYQHNFSHRPYQVFYFSNSNCFRISYQTIFVGHWSFVFFFPSFLESMFVVNSLVSF